MRVWIPEPDEPELVEWYRPLLDLGRVLRDDRFPFPLNFEDYVFAGRIDRPPRPAVWSYVHWSGAIVYVDADAQAYTWRRHRDGGGHFQKVSARSAMHRAGVFSAEIDREHREGLLPSGESVPHWRQDEWRFDPWTGQPLEPDLEYRPLPPAERSDRSGPARLRLLPSPTPDHTSTGELTPPPA